MELGSTHSTTAVLKVKPLYFFLNEKAKFFWDDALDVITFNFLKTPKIILSPSLRAIS